MRPERRQQLLLGALAVTVVVAGYLQWPRAASPAAVPAGDRSPVRATTGPAGVTAPDVHLEALNAGRVAPGDSRAELVQVQAKGAVHRRRPRRLRSRRPRRRRCPSGSPHLRRRRRSR